MIPKKKHHLFVRKILFALLFFGTIAFIQSSKAAPLATVTEGGITCNVYDEPTEGGETFAGNAACTNTNGSIGCFMVCGKTSDAKISCADNYTPIEWTDGWRCKKANIPGQNTSHTYGTITSPSPAPTISPDPIIFTPPASPKPVPAPSPVTPSDKTAPVISEISVSPDQTSATIIWITDEASNSQISYGTSILYGSATKLDSTLTTNHKVIITGLKSETVYNFSVRSKDGVGNLGKGSNQTFKTLTPAPAPSPLPSLPPEEKKIIEEKKIQSPEKVTEKVTEKKIELIDEILKEVVCSDITEKTKNRAEIMEFLKLMHKTGTYLPSKDQKCKPTIKTKWNMAIPMALTLADESCSLDVSNMPSNQTNAKELRSACMTRALELGLIEKKRQGNINKVEFYELIMKGANLASVDKSKLPKISYPDIDADSTYYNIVAQAKYYGFVKTYKKKGKAGYILPKQPLMLKDALHMAWKALKKSK